MRNRKKITKYLDAGEAEDIIFWGYLYQEKKCFGLDYNDLIKYVLFIFSTNEDIRLKWNLDGSYRYPSRFIFNVDKTLLAYTDELDERLVSETNWNISHSEKMLEAASSGFSYKPGDRVVHSIMGPGEVVNIDRDKAAYVIKFDKLGTLRKINFKVKLEKG